MIPFFRVNFHNCNFFLAQIYPVGLGIDYFLCLCEFQRLISYFNAILSKKKSYFNAM